MCPPSTGKVAPLIQRASSLARKTAPGHVPRIPFSFQGIEMLSNPGPLGSRLRVPVRHRSLDRPRTDTVDSNLLSSKLNRPHARKCSYSGLGSSVSRIGQLRPQRAIEEILIIEPRPAADIAGTECFTMSIALFSVTSITRLISPSDASTAAVGLSFPTVATLLIRRNWKLAPPRDRDGRCRSGRRLEN